MKVPQIVIFLSIVLGIYTLVNLFIYFQTRPVFNLPTLGVWLRLIFLLFVLSYPFGRILEMLVGGHIPTLFVRLGSTWLAFMLYLTLLFSVFLLLALLLNSILKIDIKGSIGLNRLAVGVIYMITLTIVLVGYVNAINPKISQIDIATCKPLPNGELKIVMASDIHLGTIIGKNDLAKLVDRVNKENPDMVLFVGDIFDEDIAPVVNGQMGELFEGIKTKHGTFAVTGNHEFFSNHQAKIEYLNKHGVTVLSDTVVSVAGINIVGRYDRQSSYIFGRARKSLPELLENIDSTKFLVVMDHQPFNLNEAVEAGADLLLSGHTHHGQLWPFNYITQAIYEVSTGFKKKNNTYIYVSPGYGTWGPRVRLGNRPEIAVISVKHKE